MVDIGKRVVAGATQPQRLLVVAEAVGADTRAAERVAAASPVTDRLEAGVRLGVEPHGLAVVARRVCEKPELAQGKREHQRLPHVQSDLVRGLERRSRCLQLVLQQPREAEPRERYSLAPLVAWRSG